MCNLPRPKCINIFFIIVLILTLSMLIIGCPGGGGGGDDDDDDNTSPTSAIISPSDDYICTEGDNISFIGTGSDDEDGNLTENALVWASDIDGQIGTGPSFSTATLSVGMHTITLTVTDSKGASDIDSINIIVALFYDNFEDNDCLNKWTVGGRQQEGTNIADCELRNESNKGHLFKFSFTEITLTPAMGAFTFSDNLMFEFEMEVRVSSTGGAPSNYYGMSGIFFSFYDSGKNLLGWVRYVAATTQYPFNNVAADPTKSAIEITQNVATSHSLSVEDILSNIDIDETQISTVEIILNTYSSTRPNPSVEAELWIDNVVVLESDE